MDGLSVNIYDGYTDSNGKIFGIWLWHHDHRISLVLVV